MRGTQVLSKVVLDFRFGLPLARNRRSTLHHAGPGEPADRFSEGKLAIAKSPLDFGVRFRARLQRIVARCLTTPL